MSDLIEWIVGWFIETDMKEIHQTEAELCELGTFDQWAADTANQAQDDNPTPTGKMVI